MNKKLSYGAVILILGLTTSSTTCKKEENEQNSAEQDLRGGYSKATLIDWTAPSNNDLHFILEPGSTPAQDKEDVMIFTSGYGASTKVWKQSSAAVVEPSTTVTVEYGITTIMAHFKNAVPDTFTATKNGKTVTYIIPRDSIVTIKDFYQSGITGDIIKSAVNSMFNNMNANNTYYSRVNN